MLGLFGARWCYYVLSLRPFEPPYASIWLYHVWLYIKQHMYICLCIDMGSLLKRLRCQSQNEPWDKNVHVLIKGQRSNLALRTCQAL